MVWNPGTPATLQEVEPILKLLRVWNTLLEGGGVENKLPDEKRLWLKNAKTGPMNPNPSTIKKILKLALDPIS